MPPNHRHFTTKLLILGRLDKTAQIVYDSGVSKANISLASIFYHNDEKE
jgi:hypothetical protein